MAIGPEIASKLRELFPPGAGERAQAGGDPLSCFTIQQIIDAGLLETQMVQSMDECLQPVHQELISAIEVVRRVGETKSMFEF